MKFLTVGLGGAFGAAARYAISLIPLKIGFPLLTLGTNFFGAFLIGVVVGMAEVKGMSENSVLFWKTGICGGFTTFSTFSLETTALIEKGNTSLGVAYAVLSVGLCLVGVFMGKSVVNAVV